MAYLDLTGLSHLVSALKAKMDFHAEKGLPSGLATLDSSGNLVQRFPSTPITLLAAAWTQNGDYYEQAISLPGLTAANEAALAFSLEDIAARTVDPVIGATTQEGSLLVLARSAVDTDLSAIVTIIGRAV